MCPLEEVSGRPKGSGYSRVFLTRRPSRESRDRTRTSVVVTFVDPFVVSEPRPTDLDSRSDRYNG